MTALDFRDSLDVEHHEDRFTPVDLPNVAVDAAAVLARHRLIPGPDCSCNARAELDHTEHVALALYDAGLLDYTTSKGEPR
jgi:hypothetical protein